MVAGMRFAQETPEGYAISAFAAGEITINEEVIRENVVITPERIIRDWLPERFEDLEAAHLMRLLELDPEIIVLGTGETLRFPAPEITAGALTRGIGVEVMDTGAACRTYNILHSEGRQVVVALLLG
jgi:uncharacterized protein